MIKAVYITNGAFDAVVVPDGTYLDVTPEVMQHFLEAEENGDNFSDWHRLTDWPIEEKSGDHDDDIWEAAQQLGDIIASFETDTYGGSVSNSSVFSRGEEMSRRDHARLL